MQASGAGHSQEPFQVLGRRSPGPGRLTGSANFDASAGEPERRRRQPGRPAARAAPAPSRGNLTEAGRRGERPCLPARLRRLVPPPFKFKFMTP